MKRIALWICPLMLLSLPLQAGGVGPMVSYWDTDDAGDDVGFGGRLNVDLGGSPWNLELRAAWFDELELFGDGINFRGQAFPIDVGLSYEFGSGRAQPYLGAGFTYLDVDVQPTSSELGRRIESRSGEEAGTYFVAGVDVPVGSRELGVFFEAMYRQIEVTVSSTDFVDFSPSFDGVTANFGLQVRW